MRSTVSKCLRALLLLPVVPALAAEAPSAATAVGYSQNTFSANFTSANVDLSNSRNQGYSWYLWNLYNSHANAGAVGINADGSVTLAGDTTGPGGEIMTATSAKNAAGFVGTAFGGGAYIEATFKFNPDDVTRDNSKHWPAFWSLAAEASVKPGGNQWPGQPQGYQHQIEADFFEYLLQHYGGPKNAYASSLHDWYGVYKSTCAPAGYCQVGFEFNESKRITPSSTDFTRYHTYGTLWVPATSANQGYIQFFFDGQPIGATKKWSQYNGQPPDNLKQSPWAFGVIDQQHLVLILGTGPQEPLTVQSVNVWQASDAQNLHN